MGSSPKRVATPTIDGRQPANRRRIHTVSFDPPSDEWVNALVDLLKDAGYPKAARSEIVRVGLLELQRALRGRTRADILKFFVLREAERVLATFDGALRLPFD